MYSPTRWGLEGVILLFQATFHQYYNYSHKTFTSKKKKKTKTFTSFFRKFHFPSGSNKNLYMSFHLLIRQQSGVQKQEMPSKKEQLNYFLPLIIKIIIYIYDLLYSQIYQLKLPNQNQKLAWIHQFITQWRILFFFLRILCGNIERVLENWMVLLCSLPPPTIVLMDLFLNTSLPCMNESTHDETEFTFCFLICP